MSKKYTIVFISLLLSTSPLMDSSARFHWGPWYGAPLAAGLITVAALPLVLRRNDETIYVPQSFYQQYNQAPFIQTPPSPVIVVYVQDPNQQYPQGNAQPMAIIPYNPSPPNPN